MFNAILRERRRKKWKSAKRWQQKRDRKDRLERELRRLGEYVEPDLVHNHKGVLIGFHLLRSKFGKSEIRVEFSRKFDSRRSPENQFAFNDLPILVEAIREAHRRCKRLVATGEFAERGKVIKLRGVK